MMTLLAALLALNALLHALIVGRFGLSGNLPPAAFAAIYALLALAVMLAWPLALWAVLALTAAGAAGLAANLRRIAHDTTIERAILALDAVIALVTLWLLAAG